MKAKPPKLKIERGIPLPTAKSRAGYQAQLRQMKVGDSVLFTEGNAKTIRQRGMAAFGSGGYAVRTLKEGVRLWRLK